MPSILRDGVVVELTEQAFSTQWPGLDTLKRKRQSQVDQVRDGYVYPGRLVVNLTTQQVGRGVTVSSGDEAFTLLWEGVQNRIDFSDLCTAANILTQRGVTQPVLKIRDVNDAEILLTPAIVQSIGLAIFGYVESVYAAARVHRQAIEDLETAEAVRGYTILTGWPA